MELICNAFKRVICRGGYNLEGVLEKIDTYHIEGKLTDAERDELRQVAIDCADIVNHPEYKALLEKARETVHDPGLEV